MADEGDMAGKGELALVLDLAADECFERDVRSLSR